MHLRIPQAPLDLLAEAFPHDGSPPMHPVQCATGKEGAQQVCPWGQGPLSGRHSPAAAPAGPLKRSSLAFYNSLDTHGKPVYYFAVTSAKESRLVKAVERFLDLRTSIFPNVRGAEECAALEELESAVKAAGGRVPYDEDAPASSKKGSR